MSINETSEWAKLHQHQRATRFVHMRDLFAADAQRFAKMHEKLHGLLLDYSKNRMTEDTLDLLLALARRADLPQWMQKMRTGEKINFSENRAVLHTALRLPEDAVLESDGRNIVPLIHRELNRALDFAESLRSGSLKNHCGQRFDAVVNLGIGGSDLGPKMLACALADYAGGLTVRFTANADGSDLMRSLQGLNPASTMFIVSSKSFSTPETMMNAAAARAWLRNALPENAVRRHFAAVTANTGAAAAQGILPAQTFRIFDWVGGRYSATSAIGLPLMCAVGSGHFRDFLAGAHAMDNHFFNAPLRHNMPVLLALTGIWYNTFYRAHSYALIPYSHRLRHFPAHIQQLDMESNGKQTSRTGEYLDFNTGPIIWGEEGVNCQHAFFQLMHQGSRLIPSDFILFAGLPGCNAHRQRVLTANALAQTRALMYGKTPAEVYAEMHDLPGVRRDELMPQKHFPGNQPSNTLFFDALTPFNMGMLLALYEHKVFVQGVVWGINSFDQWGVEYGKVLARAIEPDLAGSGPTHYDSSTNGLIAYFREKTADNAAIVSGSLK